MKKFLALIASMALTLSMAACGTGTSGNINNDTGGISADFDALGEKIGDLLGIESKEEKELKNPLFKEGLLAVRKDGKWGYIDESGSFVIEPKFLTADNFQSNGLAIASSGDSDNYGNILYGLIDKSGNYVVEPNFVQIEKFQSNGLAIVSKAVYEKGEPHIMLGAIDESGNYVIYPIYGKIEEFDKNGIAKIGINAHMEKIYDRENQYWYDDYVYDWGLVNENGDIILEPKCKEIGDFIHGWARVNNFPDFNYIDKDGNYLIDYSNTEFGYDFLTNADDFDFNGLAQVTVGDFFVRGFIDTKGNCPVEIKYYDLGHYAKNGLTYAYTFGGKYGFIDEKGNYVIEPQFDKAEDFDYDGYAKVNIGYKEDTVEGVISEGKWGLIDERGNYLIEPIYNSIPYIKYGIAIIMSDTGVGFVNVEKNIIVEPTYFSVAIENDKFVRCDMFSESIYMDFDGNININAKNAVSVNNHYVGYIDEEGNAQIDKQLLNSAEFINGAQSFYCNGKYGVIDSEGNVNFVNDAKTVGQFSTNGISRVSISTDTEYLFGYVNTNGDYVIEPQYSEATHFYDDNYAVAVKNNECEIINENGENVFGKKFENVIVNHDDWSL